MVANIFNTSNSANITELGNIEGKVKGKEKKSSWFQEPHKRASGSKSFSSPGASSCLHWPPALPRRHHGLRSLPWEDGSPHPPLESSPSCSETAWDRRWREKHEAPCAGIPSEGFWNIRGTDCCCSEETWQWGSGPGSRDTATPDSAKELPNSGQELKRGALTSRSQGSRRGLWETPELPARALGPGLCVRLSPASGPIPPRDCSPAVAGSRRKAQLRAGRAPTRPWADPSLRPQVPSPRHWPQQVSPWRGPTFVVLLDHKHWGCDYKHCNSLEVERGGHDWARVVLWCSTHPTQKHEAWLDSP